MGTHVQIVVLEGDGVGREEVAKESMSSAPSDKRLTPSPDSGRVTKLQ